MENLAVLNNKQTITSLELVEQINIFRGQENKSELAHKTLLGIIRDEFEEEIGEQELLPSSYTTGQNKDLSRHTGSCFYIIS